MINVTKCRSCGADIIFITTENGRKMPCNRSPVYYQENIKSATLIVTDFGKVLRATVITSPSDSGLIPVIDGKGYTPHWATCPFANLYRKRQGK